VNHLKKLGLDTRNPQTALKLLANSMLYAHKTLTTTGRALEKCSCSQGLEQGAACHPSDPHYFFFVPGRDSRLFEPTCLLFLDWCRKWFHCLRSFSFFS